MFDRLLEQIVVGQAYAFMLAFARVGAAFALLPGFADAFVPARVRLLLAMTIAAVVSPVIAPLLPPLPESALGLGLLVITESFIGLFIGTVARIMLAALEVAGIIISTQSGFAAVMLFNPAMASQGSLIGAMLSMAGVVLLFVTDLHHLLISAIVGSYDLFRPGAELPIADLGRAIVDVVGRSFAVGAQMAAPFLIVFLLLNIGMGVLQRLAPQVQIFFVMLSVQVGLGLFLLTLILTAMMLYWLGQFEDTLIGFLR